MKVTLTKEMCDALDKAWHESNSYQALADVLLEGYELAPFELSDHERAALEDARQNENPRLYPTARSAILVTALDRAQRTLVPKRANALEYSDAQIEQAFQAYMSFRDGEPFSQWARAMLAAAGVPAQPLQLAPAEPQPDAPTNIASLPAYWDERRKRQGKPDASRCGAELRIALAHAAERKP